MDAWAGHLGVRHGVYRERIPAPLTQRAGAFPSEPGVGGFGVWSMEGFSFDTPGPKSSPAGPSPPSLVPVASNGSQPPPSLWTQRSTELGLCLLIGAGEQQVRDLISGPRVQWWVLNRAPLAGRGRESVVIHGLFPESSDQPRLAKIFSFIRDHNNQSIDQCTQASR